VDPRTVLADGSGTPVDVTANRTDPGAVGLAAGVAEFELSNPTVAIAGSATAAAPHLVIALDTRGRSGIAVRFVLRDIDGSGADAVEPVALQYRAGESSEFTNAPGGYVADATSGPGEASKVTEVRTVLPAAADNQQLVNLRVITTNADGRDEWVGVDDIEVSATAAGNPGGDCGGGDPAPAPTPPPLPSTPPVPSPPAVRPPELSELELTPDAFTPAKRGPAIVTRGRSGARLRVRLSRAALVRFGVWPVPVRERTLPAAFRARFQVRGRRGLNRMRFTGRLRGRPLPEGAYLLEAVATDRAGRVSAPAAVRFRIVARP
jgi:hypothetical protein